MAYIIEYAHLAQKPYNLSMTEKQKETKEGKLAIAAGSVSNWRRVIDIDPDMLPSKHFYGQLFVKLVNGIYLEAVVSIRGTEPFDIANDWVDICAFESEVLAEGENDRIPHYLHQAVLFYSKCVAYVRHHFPSIGSVKITGHSLGGALAQLIVLVAGYGAPVVAFNSPGCGCIPGVKKNLSNWIIEVNSRYGFINKIGLPVGKSYFIDVTQNELYAKKFFDSFDKNSFKSSKNDYLLAANGSNSFNKYAYDIQGIQDRLATYRNSLENFAHAEPFRVPIYSDLRKNSPLSKSLNNMKGLIEFGHTVKAQHSMVNMINALQKNSAISSIFF